MEEMMITIPIARFEKLLEEEIKFGIIKRCFERDKYISRSDFEMILDVKEGEKNESLSD